MEEPQKTFVGLVAEILRRFWVQNGKEPLPDEIFREWGMRLWTLIGERGLPAPLGPTEMGSPGDLPEGECATLLDFVLGETPPAEREWVAVPLRQLIKACFHREFKTCRDSFREVSKDGSCRRQQLARVRGRVSGTHCIDCPYWVVFPSEKHVSLLEREWQPEGRDDLRANLAIYLPEDFRRLRRWLYGYARGQDIGL